MQPITRRYARVINDLDGVLRRLRNLTEEIARLELDSTALHNSHKHDAARSRFNGAELEKRIDAAEIYYDPALKDVEPDPDGIRWEKAGELHVQVDPQTGQTEMLTGQGEHDE
jgi:hypothetical protein